MSSTTTESMAVGSAVTGEKLRELRHAAGLTRYALVRQADCSLSAYSAFEAGAIPKRSAVLVRVLAVLASSGAPNDVSPAGNRADGKASDDALTEKTSP